MRAGEYIIKQSKVLLENKQKAILIAVILSILPFASWLSVALIALITLRKGAKSGFEVMLPALVIHSMPLMIFMPPEGALINALLAYLPCYLAALSLRKAANWETVFGVFFVQALIGFWLIQMLDSNLVLQQLTQFKKLLGQFQNYQQFIDDSTEGINVFILAHLFFGIQILMVMVSAIISLMFARSIQAKLFLPGGFKKELMKFRSGRLSFLALLGTSIGAYYEVPCAIDLLPLILFYFVLSGFNLVYFIFGRKKQINIFIFLVLVLLLKPVFILFALIVFGSLDSLFNFRLYLPARMRESI